MLIDDIKKDMMQAKISRETVKANLLSALYSEIYTLTKSGKESGDEDAVKVIRKFLKNANETVALDIPEDQKNKLQNEINILESYLPNQMTIEEVVAEVIRLTGEGMAMKEIMAYFKLNYAGRYDGRMVNEKVKELASKDIK